MLYINATLCDGQTTRHHTGVSRSIADSLPLARADRGHAQSLLAEVLQPLGGPKYATLPPGCSTMSWSQTDQLLLNVMGDDDDRLARRGVRVGHTAHLLESDAVLAPAVQPVRVTHCAYYSSSGSAVCELCATCFPTEFLPLDPSRAAALCFPAYLLACGLRKRGSEIW